MLSELCLLYSGAREHAHAHTHAQPAALSAVHSKPMMTLISVEVQMLAPLSHLNITARKFGNKSHY